METRSNQVLVGSITLGLLAALVVFVVWLSQVGSGGDKRYDIFFTQSVEGLAKGSSVTFSGVPVGQIESINLVPDSPQFIRVRVSVNGDTPVLEGSTATIRGVGFTGVSQIQIDPPPAPTQGQRPRPRREIRCPDQNAQAECPYGVPVLPVRPGAIASILNTAPELLERVSTRTEQSAQSTIGQLEHAIGDARPGIQAFSNQTLPEVGQLMRELRAATESLREIMERLNQQGVGGVIGGQRLPDYRGGRRNR